MSATDRSTVGLAMVAHALVHTYELSIPVFLTVWLTAFETTTATLGAAVTAGYAAFGLGAVPGGILADRYGSKRLVVACLAGMGLSFLLVAAAPTLPVVALALFCWGVAASVYHPAGLSLLSTGVSERGRAFAYHGMAGNAGIALGPLVVTLLLVGISWRLVAAVLAIPALVAAGLATRVRVSDTRSDDVPDSLSELRTRSRALFSGAFLAVFAAVIASGLYYRGVLTFLPTVLGDFPSFAPVEVWGTTLEPARYAYVALLAVGMAGQYVSGRATDVVRPARGLAVVFVLLALVAPAVAPAAERGVVPFLVVGTCLGLALFAAQPLYQASVAAYTPESARGLSYGFTYFGVFGVGALGSTLAGWVLAVASPAVLFAVLAVVAGCGALAALLAERVGGTV